MGIMARLCIATMTGTIIKTVDMTGTGIILEMIPPRVLHAKLLVGARVLLEAQAHQAAKTSHDVLTVLNDT